MRANVTVRWFKAEWIQYEGIVFQGGTPVKPCRRCNSILERLPARTGAAT